MCEDYHYQGRPDLRIRTIRRRLRLIALFLACAFCFVQQVAELHYARTHGVRENSTAHQFARQVPGSSYFAGLDSVQRSPDNCALCTFEATLLRPAATATPSLEKPAAVSPAPLVVSATPAGAVSHLPLALSAPRAPPLTLS